MPVIDFRTRPNTDEWMANYPDDYAKIWEREPFEGPVPAESLDAFVDRLRANDIDRGVFTGRQHYVDGELDMGVSNDYVADCVEQYPDDIIGFAGIDHTAGIEDMVDEAERAVEDLGLDGFAFDPGYYGDTLPNDPRIYPVYQKAVEYDVPVVITMGPNLGEYFTKNHDPYPIEKIAVDFPDMTMVLSHGVWPRVDEFVALAYRRPNVYLEASFYEFFPGADIFIEAADDLIADSVVYASSFPFNPIDTINRFRDLPLSDDALEQILWENPAEILGLD